MFMIQFLTEGKHVFNFDPSKEARLGLLPRYANNESQIRWFTIPPCMIFHTGKYLVACHIHYFHFVNSIIMGQVVMNESNPISKDICFQFAQYVMILYHVI
jgi:carotenoid cleavage dioxygenase-like enzyme